MKTTTVYECIVCGIPDCSEPRHVTGEPVTYVSLSDLLELIEGEAAKREAVASASDRYADAAFASVRAHELELLARRIRKETQPND